MFPIERRQSILNYLSEKKSVTVKELSKRYYIGEATIRRDLERLERKGLLKRTYGGAVLLDGLGAEIPLSVREIEQKDAKDAIAYKAARLVKDGDIVILDSSSTVLKMVGQLKGKDRLTIITNGAKTALDLSELDHINVYCTGGMLRENSLSYIGELTRKCINGFFADVLFFSCRAIDMKKGLSDISDDEAELRRLMIENCSKAVFLCDSSKFDKISFCKVCDIGKIDCIITDRKLSTQWEDCLHENGIEIFYAFE